MAIIVGTQEEIVSYFESEDVNQSTLKSLIPGLDNFILERDKEQVEKDYFLIGGAVDTILTGEKGEFEKQYYVSQLEKKPSEVEISIITTVFDELVGADVIEQVDFEDCYDAILIAANEVGWQKNWKDDTRVSKIIEKGTEYFEDLKSSLGMKILTSEMKSRIDAVVMSLTTNERTKKYFDREQQSQFGNMDFYYQLPIYFSYEGIGCKALLDLLVVHKDENGKIVKLEPIDLKTMSGNTLDFGGKLRHHRYDIQAAWYVEALTHWMSAQGYKREDYTIENFKFIVESTTNTGRPLVYQVSDNTLGHGMYGSPKASYFSENGRELFYPEVKGWRKLIMEYIHYNNEDFKEDVVLAVNPEILEIDYLKGIL